MSCGAQRCDTVGDIVSKWELHDVGRNRATCAWIRIAGSKGLRVEGDVRCAEIADLVTHKSKKKKIRMRRTWSKTLESWPTH